MLSWDDVQLFLAIAEGGSLSRAAKKLQTGQPTVSRRLAALEYALGYPLFHRKAEGARLTSAGERLLPAAKKMAEWAGEWARHAASEDSAPRGVVRIAAPPGVAADFLAPFAAWLKTQHPDLSLQVLSSIHYLDLARGEADLALRARPAQTPDLINLIGLEHLNGVMAAPSLAAQLPAQTTLATLPWIVWAPPFEDVTPNPQLAQLIPNFKPVFSSDNYLVQLAALEAGVGVMVFGQVHHPFFPPRRVLLPIDLGPHGKSQMYLVCARSAYDIPRVRKVAELLVKILEESIQKSPGAKKLPVGS